ncbi:nitrilase-related carbon-nitrogen hydrolase [Alloyangia pacifica]|uniref:nitrilase-related carbon-nitrogen hydrolase n=1 Tax=Alloyangia pacifica TaxID=311180 RepID=UPI001CFDF82D|nr:nitrilase-related carbon-nitrogen hydrolase [Alloyangia pacifica]
MSTFTAAALQLGPASETMAETTDRILALMAQAAGQGARIAVLPELALQPYFAAEVHADLSRWTDAGETEAALGRIAAACERLGLALSVSHAEPTEARLYNSMTFIAPDGHTCGMFRKVHIPGHVEPDPAKDVNILERRYFAPGNLGFPAYAVEGVTEAPLRTGGLICYDRRFPESWRSLMLNGADLFCVCYNTPVMNGATLAQARHASELAICGGAYSNATWTIAAGKGGVENGISFIGGSFICGPDGVIVARAETMGDEVVLAEIDMARQQALRARWNFAETRAEHAYVGAPALKGMA